MVNITTSTSTGQLLAFIFKESFDPPLFFSITIDTILNSVIETFQPINLSFAGATTTAIESWLLVCIFFIFTTMIEFGIVVFLSTLKEEKVSISPTFYKQLFLTKVFCTAFLYKVCLCNFLSKNYQCKSCS